MADRTKIEWTDATFTPIRARNKVTGKVGWHCEHATPGCEFCYSESMNRRLGTGLPFKPGHRADIGIFLDKNMLLQPLRWKRPRMIFVCSMTDLFADFVPDEWIDQVFAVMALCPQHTMQVLTKRSARMRAYCSDPATPHRIARACIDLWVAKHVNAPAIGDQWPVRSIGDVDIPDDVSLKQWPLPSVWLGVSTEDQRRADERVPDLMFTPAAVRFVSAEPLLGPIDFSRWTTDQANFADYCDAVGGPAPKLMMLDWIIVGGESGPNARPMSTRWARDIRDQCAAAGTAFLFKQFGEWAPAGFHQSEEPGCFAFGDYEHDPTRFVTTDHYPRQFTMFGARCVMERVGKKAAGRLLDGIEHNGLPEVRQ